MPAERLRSARIALLKATHWPLVALILAYEHRRQQHESRERTRSPSAAVRGPNAPSTLRRSISVRQTQRSTAGRSALNSLVQEARAGDSTVGTSSETAELEAVVSRLKAQLDDISALLARAKTN